MSDGKNYIIVNNEAGSAISDGFADLVRFIDSHKKENDASLAPLATEFKEAMGADASEELPLPKSTQPIFVKIAEHAGALLKAPPSEFEPAFNLLWYVLSSAPDFDAVISIALEKLTHSYPSVHAQKLALLAVLGSLFNITAADSSLKPTIFSKIVDLAAQAQATNQFVPQLPQLAEWLREWQIDAEAKQAIVHKLADNIGSQYHEKVLAFLSTVVRLQPELTESAKQLVSFALNDASAYDFDSLLALPGVQALKGKFELYDAMQAIAIGDFASFSKLSSADITGNALLNKKVRVTTVARLASSVKNNELAYEEVVNVLSLSDSEVEPLLVDTIKAGLVRGRMNQLQRKFYVESATVIGGVTEHHWDVIESRLAAWKKSLSAIVEVSERARSNHDLVKTLNKLEVN